MKHNAFSRAYCEYCHINCFIGISEDWPWYILAAFEKLVMITTCAQGMAREKEQFGYCWLDIAREIKAPMNWRNGGYLKCPLGDGDINPESHQADPCIHCGYVYHDKCFYTRGHDCVKHKRIKERKEYGVKL